MAQASDVPGRFDLVVNGTGFILDRAEAPQAVHELTPTFVERQNVTGSYGDNQQDFWMTMSQNDWSGGEQQKFIRVNDAESRRRYWRGSGVDISVEGQVGLQPNALSLSVAGTVIASCNWRGVPVFTVGTSLYRVDSTTVSTVGAFTSALTGHGAYGLTADDVNVFIACPTGGTDGAIRKWDGSSFTDFAPSLGVTSVEFLNNVLYGIGATTSGKTTLYSFDTAGGSSVIYEWQAADGARDAKSFGRMRRAGGELLMVTLTQAAQLFSYTGDAPVEIAQPPPDFLPTELAVCEGIIFIGGSFLRYNYTAAKYLHQPAVLYYIDGALNELWRADAYETSGSSSPTDTLLTANPVPYLNGVVWWDAIRAQLTYYDVRTGAINGVSANTAMTGLGCFSGKVFTNGPSSGVSGLFPEPASIVSTGYVRTSLFDSDSSLLKYWKSLKVDADIPTGGSFDIAYRVNDLDGSYTTVQTTATSGTEYTIGTTGRSISVQVTMNKGSSASPTVRRIYVRGMPLLDTFKRKSYVVDCSGVDARDPVVRRDGTPETSTGLQLATVLVTAAAATSPFTVSDEFGSITALIEPQTLRVERMRDREYRASFTLRQV